MYNIIFGKLDRVNGLIPIGVINDSKQIKMVKGLVYTPYFLSIGSKNEEISSYWYNEISSLEEAEKAIDEVIARFIDHLTNGSQLSIDLGFQKGDIIDWKPSRNLKEFRDFIVEKRKS